MRILSIITISYTAISLRSVNQERHILSYKTKGCVLRSPFFVRSRIVAYAVCVDVLADVQHALNTIRDITRKEQAAVCLDVLRLLASTIADEARDIEGVKVKAAKGIKQLPTLPIPKSANPPKPTQIAPKQQAPQQDFEPIQAIKPIAPK